MKSIKEQIKAGTLKGAYLIYGEENYLKDYYTDQIVSICLSQGPAEFNYMKINNEKINNDSIAEFIVSLPFMADKKVLLIKNSGIFSKANEADKKFWIETLSNIPDYLIIVFHENAVDKRSALYKALAKDHTAEEFPLSKEADLIKWLANIIAKDGKSMTKEDICFVIENVGRNMYLLKNEAEKLISFTSGGADLIDRKSVEECICKSLESRVFSLIDYIVDSNKPKAIACIRDLKTLREQPVMIVALIFRQFSILRKIKVLQDKYSVYEIAQKLKMRDFFVKKHISQLKNFTTENLDNAIFLCSKTDSDIKSGLCDQWLAIEKLAVSLMINRS